MNFICIYVYLYFYKHALIGSDAYPLPLIKLLAAWFADVTLQSTRHEVILPGLQDMTSERQVISYDPSVLRVAGNALHIYVVYNKTIVDLCLLRDGQYEVYCSITLHVHLNISQ